MGTQSDQASQPKLLSAQAQIRSGNTRPTDEVAAVSGKVEVQIASDGRGYCRSCCGGGTNFEVSRIVECSDIRSLEIDEPIALRTASLKERRSAGMTHSHRMVPTPDAASARYRNHFRSSLMGWWWCVCGGVAKGGRGVVVMVVWVSGGGAWAVGFQA